MTITYSLVKPTEKMLEEIRVNDTEGAVRVVEGILRRHGFSATDIYFSSTSEMRMNVPRILPKSAIRELAEYCAVFTSSLELYSVQLAMLTHDRCMPSIYRKSTDSLMVPSETVICHSYDRATIETLATDKNYAIRKIKKRTLRNTTLLSDSDVEFLYKRQREDFVEPAGEAEDTVFDKITHVCYFANVMLSKSDLLDHIVPVSVDDIISERTRAGEAEMRLNEMFVAVNGKKYRLNSGMAIALEEIIKKHPTALWQ